jgi:hypothetical protein
VKHGLVFVPFADSGAFKGGYPESDLFSEDGLCSFWLWFLVDLGSECHNHEPDFHSRCFIERIHSRVFE